MLRFAGILTLVAVVDAPLFFLGIMEYGPVLAWTLLAGTAIVGLLMLGRGIAFRFDRHVHEDAPKELLLEPLGTVLSGFLLVLPGPISDCVGALLMIRPLRHATAALLLRILGREAFVGSRPMQWSFRLDEDAEEVGPGEANGERPAGEGAPAGVRGGSAADDSANTEAPADAGENRAVRDVSFEVLEDEESPSTR